MMQTLLPMLCSLLALGLAADAPRFAGVMAVCGIAGLLAARRAGARIVAPAASPSTSAAPDNTANALRAALFLVVAWLFYNAYSGDGGGAPETILAWGIARLAAGEWAIRCWQRDGLGEGRRIFRVLLPGLVLMGATNTFETDFVRWLVPVWFGMVLLGVIEPERSQPGRIVPRRTLVFRSLAIVCVLCCGLVSHALVTLYRFDIARIGAKMLGERNMGEPSGLSTEPRLGATFGTGGSLTRVLRLHNWPPERGYLRALSFDTYQAGAWLPTPRTKKFFPVSPKWQAPGGGGETVHVERLINDDNMLFAPVDTTSIVVSGDGHVPLEWARGGPLRSDENAPDPLAYDFVLPKSGDGSAPALGIFARPPAGDELQKLLNVPDEMPLEMHLLAQKIAGAEVDPRRQIAAVEAYLISHHQYSLTTDPGAGDPVASFVDSDKAAHCEYFASAAVMLLRCLGIPTRYCIGYYLHETDGAATIVRFRDAHAWAESYIEGRGGGWVTVEATPGGARPGASGEAVPFWQKVRERTQDFVAAIRSSVLALAKTPHIGLALLALAIIGIIAVAAARLAERVRAGRDNRHDYARRSHELDDVARRFERWLKSRAKRDRTAVLPAASPAPPVQTWREALSAAVLEDDARAREWLRLYDAARFGREPGDTRRLRFLLQQLEQTPFGKDVQGEPHETTGKHHAH